MKYSILFTEASVHSWECVWSLSRKKSSARNCLPSRSHGEDHHLWSPLPLHQRHNSCVSEVGWLLVSWLILYFFLCSGQDVLHSLLLEEVLRVSVLCLHSVVLWTQGNEFRHNITDYNLLCASPRRGWGSSPPRGTRRRRPGPPSRPPRPPPTSRSTPTPGTPPSPPSTSTTWGRRGPGARSSSTPPPFSVRQMWGDTDENTLLFKTFQN